MVAALREQGRYVAMLGDGVNDVPALKEARLAIAQGSGAQMAKSVADLVLVHGDFSAVPGMVAEGRQILRNLQRVAKLYVTKSAFAAFLILTVGTTATAYPLIPRHFSLAASLTIGIPSFLLALAPSSGSWHTPRLPAARRRASPCRPGPPPASGSCRATSSPSTRSTSRCSRHAPSRSACSCWSAST